MSEKAQVSFEFGPFRLDEATHSLTRGDESVQLPPKAFETLLLLVRNSGRVLSKQELMKALWPDSFVEEANLTQNIFLLRKALGEDAEYIKTIPRVGYRFVAPVHELDDGESLVGTSLNRQRIVVHEEVVEHEEEAPQPASAKSLPAAPGAPNLRRISPATLIVGAIVAAALISGIIWLARERNSKAAMEASAPIDSIAVLPFANQAGSPDSEYLSDGITESLINSLTQLPELRVVPRTTVFHYKNAEADPQDIGHKLNVQAILVGRLIQKGDTLNIQTELIDIRTDSQLWGAQYDRKLSDVLAIQQDIATEISEKLRLRLSHDEKKRLSKHYTENNEAYRLYLEGRYNAVKYTPVGVKKAIECFEKAIAIDPNYALAYDGLAYCYYAADWWDYPGRESMLKGRAFAQKALEIDPTLAQAHSSLGVIHTWVDYDWQAAENEFQRALELNRNDASAHLWHGFLLTILGKLDEGIAEGKRAAELDPLSPEANSSVGVYLFLARRYDEAMQQLRTTIQLQPDYWFAHLYLGRVYEQKGDLPAAITELEQATKMPGAAPEVWSALGYAYAMSGKKDEALKVVRELKTQSKSVYVYNYNFAVIYAGLGEKDLAFEYLEKEYNEGAYYLDYLKLDPEVDGLRSDPRFAKLVQRMNFSP